MVPVTLLFLSVMGMQLICFFVICCITFWMVSSCFAVCTGVVIIHRALIFSVARSRGLRHFTKFERRYGLRMPWMSERETIPSRVLSLPMSM